jgi:hypothetical protein
LVGAGWGLLADAKMSGGALWNSGLRKLWFIRGKWILITWKVVASLSLAALRPFGSGWSKEDSWS